MTFDDTIEFTSQRFIDKIDKAKASMKQRSGPNIIWMKENEDDTKLALPNYSLANGIPTMARALNDFEEGIICFGGFPNAGKSTLLVNMMIQALQLNPDLVMIDLSFDDSLKKRYQQYLASITGLSYQQITTNVQLSETETEALDKADKLIKQFYTEQRLFTFEAIERFGTRPLHMRKFSNLALMMKKLRKQFPDKKLAFFIDAWNNLDYSGQKGGNDLSQTNAMLDELQEISNELGIMVIVSAHLRKTLGKKPSMEDIKGTSNMAYNANAIFLVRNEYRENIYKDPLLWTDGKYDYPVLSIEVVKTKVSGWDLPIFYGLKSGSCQIIPLKQYEYEALRDTYNGKRQ